MYLVIDIGNTWVKTALFEAESIENIEHFKIDEFSIRIKKLKKSYKVRKAIISSVGKLPDADKELLQDMFDYMELSHDVKLPFVNKYATPSTLGVDRIALAAAAVNQFPKENILVIDAGTCITYDFIDKNKKYLGGAIAPGIKSRYRSLHDYTAKLPFLEKNTPKSFIGDSTEQSIHSGVINGVCQEIDGVIKQYKEKFKKLTVILTGGDAEFLSSQLKSSIFARPFFLLEGLYTILKHTIEDDKKN